MGGTSTDVALVQGLTPRIGRETKVGDLTVRASSVDVRTVGAGGGSIAHVPQLTKALRVGPQSAGADPGPAAYGRGGTEPTVTDANVVLGYLPPSLAGGEITLDVDAARAAVQKVADAMGLPSAEAAAAGIIDIVNENMLGGAAAGRRAAGVRPAGLRARRLRRRRPAARQRDRAAHRRLAGDRAAVARRAVRAGDATTSAAGRVGPHRAAPVRRPRPAPSCGRSCASWPTRPAAGWWTRGPAPTQQTIDYEVDVRYFGQGFEIPIDIDPAGSTTRTCSTGSAARLRHRARAAVLLPARHRPRAGQRPRHGQRPAAGGRAGHPGRRRRRPGGRAGPTRTRSTWRARSADARHLRPREAAGRRRDHRSGDRHRDGLDNPGPARPRGHRARRRAAC